ncbi:MAG: hypothetical protein Tsb008_20910 [Rhodothalassiaceae bacterium]
MNGAQFASHAERRLVLATGVAGFAAALLVGIGEGLMQFNPAGGYEAADYGYFASVPIGRLTAGHFLAVLAAPLYIAGYWHVSRMLAPASRLLAAVVFLISAYSFVVGAVWIGQRAFLGLTVHEIANGADLAALLSAFAALNEPLVTVLRIAMLLVSIIWVTLIIGGKSRYPRAMAIMSPAAMLAAIFALYFALPAVGRYFLPVAMNLVHAILFALSLLIAASRPRDPGQSK